MLAFLLFLFFWFTPKEIEIYSTDLNDSLEKAIVKDLEHAEKSITLFTYSLSSKAIMKTLKDKSAEGINVNVLVDCKASPLAKHLEPEVKTVKRICPGLMHYKAIVIDHRYIWLGSANMTGDSLKLHSNVMERIDSTSLANYIEDRFKAMGNEGYQKKAAPYITADFEMWILPDSDGTNRIKELMRSAKKSVKVAMYTFTRKDFSDTLIRLKNRGVEVEVILDRGMAEGASKKTFERLKENGISVKTRKGDGLMHHKFMIIDDDIWVHGSANWTRAAFTQNDDYFIVRKALDPRQKEEILKIWKALEINSN